MKSYLSYREKALRVKIYRKLRKKFTTKLAQELAIDHPPFTTDILEEMRRRHIHIPVYSRILAVFFYKPVEKIRKKMRHKKWARRLYYALNLDDKLDGRKQSSEERKRKLND